MIASVRSLLTKRIFPTLFPSTSLTAAVVLLALLAASGCQTRQKQKTLRELIDEQASSLKELSSYQSERQRRAMNRFLNLGKDQGGEVVVWFLNDPTVADNERVRVLLSWILSTWKDRRGMPFLLDSLESRDLGVLSLAEESFANYGEDDVLARKLGDVLGESRSVDARRVASSVLSFMKSDMAVRILAEHVRKKDESNREVRGNCLLGVVGGPASEARLKALVDCLTDPDVDNRRLSWDALQREERFWRAVNSPKKVTAIYHPASEPVALADSVASIRRWLRKHGGTIY